MSKEIQLTQGKVALVDDADYARASQYKWNAHRRGGSYYAECGPIKINGKFEQLRLHRFILGVSNNSQVDHVDGNPLNNQRSNLRICNQAQNNQNRKRQKSNTSGYKGVDRDGNKWRARISVYNKRVHLGLFDTRQEAAQAYDIAAAKYHREFARPNKAEIVTFGAVQP